MLWHIPISAMSFIKFTQPWNLLAVIKQNKNVDSCAEIIEPTPVANSSGTHTKYQWMSNHPKQLSQS